MPCCPKAEKYSDAGASSNKACYDIEQLCVACRHVLLSGALEEALSEEAGKSKQKKKRDHWRPGKLLTLMSGMQRELMAQGEGQHAQSLKQLEANRLNLLQLLESIGYPT